MTMFRSPGKITRRRFVKHSALAGGATAFLPRLLRAEEKAPASERLSLGFIGCGGMGQGHVQWFNGQPDVQVAAVCDVDQSHRETALHSLGKSDAAAHGDFRELLANDKIDAVVIATPDHWHGLAAIAAAKAGKNIYCEKPLTNSIAEGRALCQAVKENDVVLQTGSHERSNPGAAVAKRLIDEGRFGKIHTVRIQLPIEDPHLVKVKNFRGTPPTMEVPEGFDYDFWLGYAPEKPYTEQRCHFWWRFISDYGGGEMTDRGCHVIDLAQMILGHDDTGPISFQAQGKPPEPGLYDAILDFQFENNFADGLRMVGNNDSPRGVWFEGTEGRLFVVVHGAALMAEPANLLDGVDLPQADAYGIHRRNFLDAIKTGSAVMAPVEAGHRTATICHLNNIAMRLGRPFKWDPATEQSDDEEVNARLKPKMRAPWSLEG